MKLTKPVTEIVPGDKVYIDDSPNKPRTVTASYDLGAKWALEVQGVQLIVQVEKDAKVHVWTN